MVRSQVVKFRNDIGLQICRMSFLFFILKGKKNTQLKLLFKAEKKGKVCFNATFYCKHPRVILSTWTSTRIRAVKPFINEKNLLVEQVVPSNPVPVHSHVNMLTPSMQVPPFSHDPAVQSLVSADRNMP